MTIIILGWLMKSNKTTKVVKSTRKLHGDLTKQAKKLKPNNKKQALIYGVVFVVMLVIIGAAGLLAAQYRDKAMPGTTVAGTHVGGKTEAEIRDVVTGLRDSIELTIQNGEQSVTANTGDLGVTINADQTARNAIVESSSGNIFASFNPLVNKHIEIVADYDIGKLQDFLNLSFPDVTIQAIDATIQFNPDTGQFDVVPGQVGQSVDAKRVESTVRDLVARPRAETISVQTTETQPLISDAAAVEAQTFMNQRIGLRLDMNYQGQLLYFVDPPDIAAWADFLPNPNTGKIDIDFDKAKILQFVTDVVAPSLAAAPIDKKVLVDKSGNELMVIQQGRNGRQPSDMSALVDSLYSAATDGRNLVQELDLVEANYKTVSIVADDNNWIEVDLSRQTTTLYTGSTPVATFVISSGVAKWPTVTGEFRVWSKTPSQTMTGGSRADGSYYSLPNVKWVTYFYQDYGFHAKYWNNIFGAPSSHGCVNMREADAKVLYDFAPIGTKVVVHY